MVSRREVLQAGMGLPAAAALTGTGTQDRCESGDPRLLTGVAAFDAATDGIAVGGVTCLLGRPSMGKTALAMQIALSVARRHRCNVVFSSAREPARRVAARARSATVDVVVVGEMDDQDVVVRRARSAPPTVYILNVADERADAACSLVHELDFEDIGNCGLWILDGWSCYPAKQMERAMLWDGGIAYCSPQCYDRPVVLSSSAIDLMKSRAEQFGIPVVVGIRIAESDESVPGRAPVTADLLQLERPVLEVADRTVWLHRPHVYNKDLPGDASVVELTGRTSAGADVRATHWTWSG